MYVWSAQTALLGHRLALFILIQAFLVLQKLGLVGEMCLSVSKGFSLGIGGDGFPSAMMMRMSKQKSRGPRRGEEVALATTARIGDLEALLPPHLRGQPRAIRKRIRGFRRLQIRAHMQLCSTKTAKALLYSPSYFVAF